MISIERSEREIISKEKGESKSAQRAQINRKILRSCLYTRQVKILDTLKNVKFCP